MARLALLLELPLDHDFGGDAGVVGADHPVGVEAAHAVIADERVHQGLLEGVAHVQRAGDIGRRQQDAEIIGLGVVYTCGEVIAGFPDRVPAPLDIGRFEALGEFHEGK